MLSTNKGVHAVAKWLIGQGVLQQFQTAQEIQQEDTEGYAPFQPLRDWTAPPGCRQHAGEPPDPPTTTP